MRPVRRLRAPPLLRPLLPVERFFYMLGGILMPAACFLLAAADVSVGPASKESGWRGFVMLLFDREANWALGLLLAASAVALGAALMDVHRHGSKPFVRVATFGGILISATYVVAGTIGDDEGVMLWANLGALVLCAVLRRISAAHRAFANAALVLPCLVACGVAVIEPAALLFAVFFGFVAGPAWSLAAYGAMWLRLRREPFVERAPIARPLALWLASFAAALAVALVEASRLYRELPEHPPGDCYVATAAARGHPRLVRSWVAGGRRVNAQLIRLKALELALARTAPRLHAAARAIYDRAGPALAARIRHPLAADLAYLSLKPAEWTARALLAAAKACAPRFSLPPAPSLILEGWKPPWTSAPNSREPFPACARSTRPPRPRTAAPASGSGRRSSAT
jgi:hypothetical protein